MAATDERVQAYVDNQVRPHCAQLVNTLIQMQYDSDTIDGNRWAMGMPYLFDASTATGKITLDAHRNPTKSAVMLQVKNGKFAYVETIAP